MYGTSECNIVTSQSDAEKAKMLAMKKDKSLSALIRESLEEKIKKDTAYKEAMEQEIRLMEKGFNLGTGDHMPCSREELYERR